MQYVAAPQMAAHVQYVSEPQYQYVSEPQYEPMYAAAPVYGG